MSRCQIVNRLTGKCLEPRQADTKNAAIVSTSCNGSTSQRWFF